MIFDPLGGDRPTLNTLNPGDAAAPGSLFEAHRILRGAGGPAVSPASIAALDAPPTRMSTRWALDTHDPDPFGERNARLLPKAGGPVDSNYVPGLVVAGKYMTREYLMGDENGRALLEMATRNRAETKRGFLEAILDFKWSDVPFMTMFYESPNLAKEASRVMHKVADGGSVTDTERMLLGRVVMEQSRESSLGGKIGDIMRQAPGFMGEFFASGWGLGKVRSMAVRASAREGAKAVSTMTTLGVNRGTKVLARELADSEVVNLATARVGANASRADIARFISGSIDKAAREDMVSRISRSLDSFVRETVAPLGGGDELVSAVADNLARRAVASSVARQGASSAVGRWARGAMEWGREHIARGIIDHGTWGTETATILNTKLGLKSAIADAVGALTLEPLVAGLSLYAVNQVVTRGVPAALSLATGKDLTLGPTRSQLSLEMSALNTGDRKLMDMAPLIATGMNLLEYVSENAGRGFGSAARAIGLSMGVAKPAQRALVGEVGGLLKRGSEVEAGGFLRAAIRKSLGTTEAYAKRTSGVQLRAAREALKGADVADDVVAGMVSSKTVPVSLRPVIGDNYDKFIKGAVKSAYEKEANDLSYRTYFRYAVADFMARHNFGPDQTLDAFKRMGYDGILGEMLEERYSDFASALLGLDDKATHSLKENISRAFAAVSTELSMEDLVAEAVGFAFPAVTRSAVLNVQKALGGDSNVQRARAAGRNFTDAAIGMSVIEDTYGTFDRVMTERRKDLEARRAKAAEELDAQRGMLADRGITSGAVFDAQTAEHKARVSDAERAIAEHDRYVSETLKANGIEDAAAVSAGRLMNFAVSPVLRGSGGFAAKVATFYSSEQLAAARAAQDALLADAPFLGEAYDMARQFDTGEDNIALMRRIASKTLGIAAAVICGDPALAQSNSIKWASVDEGLDPGIASDLGNLHRSLRERAVLELREADATHTPAREAVEAKLREYGYEQQARDLVRSRLLVLGVRMFAHSEMLDRAAIHLAEKRGYWYDGSERVLANTKGEKVTIAQFVRDNKDEVESLRDKIGLETLRLLTDSDSVLSANRESFVSYIRLKPGDMNADPAARALAADLAGFGVLISQRELVKGVPVDDLLAEDALSISEDVAREVASIAAELGEDKVPDSLAERLASALKIPLGDMSDATLAARRHQAIQVARVASGILTGDVRVFVKHVDVGDSRLVDDSDRTIYVTKDASGMWTTTDSVRDETTEEDVATFRGDDAKLAELVEREKLEELTGRRVVLTPARALTTDDPILMLQKLGAADAVMRAGRRSDGSGFNYERVHPALRLNDSTQAPLLTDDQVAAALREELFKATYFMSHKNVADYNFKNEPWSKDIEARCEALREEYQTVYENVLGERGYMTVIDKVLTRMGVTTPSAHGLTAQVLGRKARGRYSIGLPTYTARRKSAAHYVSVDYMSGVDAVSAMVSAAIADGFNKYGARLFDNESSPTIKNAVRTFFKNLHDIVESKLRTADYDDEQRGALERFRDGVTRAYDSPSASAIALLGSALSCGQLARATREGYHCSSHDMALSIVERDARGLPSYFEFTGVVDVLLGGSAFSVMRAVREAGGSPSLEDSGIGRVVKLTGADADMAKDDIKPLGMPWAEFEETVNRYAAEHFKDRVSPAPRREGGVDSEGSSFKRMRTIFANARFENLEDIHDFFVKVGRLSPYKKNPDKVAELTRKLEELDGDFKALTRQRDELRAEITALRAARDAGRDVDEGDLNAKTEKARRVSEARKGVASDIAETRAALAAGDTLGSGETEEERIARRKRRVERSRERDRRRKEAEEREDEEEGNYFSVDVDEGGDSAPVDVEVIDEVDGSVRVVVRDAPDTPVELDAGAKETTARTVVSALHSLGEAVTKESFLGLVDDFTGGAVPETARLALWEFYMEEMSGGEPGAEEDPLDRSDVSDDENGADTTHNYGAKYLAAFDNKTLDRYLAFYRFVAPHNGRQFLAGVSGIREGVSVLRARLGEDAGGDVKLAATVRALDALFNSETVTDEGVDGHPDREALFTSRVMDLESGMFGVTLDEMVAKLMERDETGFPRFRQAAFFLSYVRSIAPGQRRRFLALACGSVSTRQVGITRIAVGEEGETKLTLSPRKPRYGAVSSLAATGSFARFAPMSSAEVRGELDRLVARLNERGADGLPAHDLRSPKAHKRIQDVCGVAADVLAPLIGRESPFVQAITSPFLFDAIRRGDARALGSDAAKAIDSLSSFLTLPRPKSEASPDNLPPLVSSVYRVLDAYAGWLASAERTGERIAPARRRRHLDAIVLTELSTHVGGGFAQSPDKDISKDTEWSRVLSAYTAGLPETVVPASTLPERNNRVGSKVVAALQDAPPVVRQFLDKPVGDETGFAHHAFRVWLSSSDGAAFLESSKDEAEALRHFESSVLPRCRQSLTWPDDARSELLAKCVDRDYSAREVYEACANSFADQWFTPMVSEASGKPNSSTGPVASSWYVPVYNGDHSAGVILRLPVSVLTSTVAGNIGQLGRLADTPVGVYEAVARRVNRWLGMDTFGTDPKRSSLACSEFPGRSMRGVRYRGGRLEKGECRVHVLHNYAMEGHNDALLGTTLATGYGVQAQRDTAKDPITQTLKLSVMSATGRDLTMIKSLIVAMPEGADGAAGAFLGGSASRALMDHISAFRKGDSDISTSILVDEDSMKVGVLNSKTMGHALPGGGFEPLMKYVFRAIKAHGGADGKLSGEGLDKVLCDNWVNGGPVADADGAFRFGWIDDDGNATRKTVGELLGADTADAIQVNVVKGLSGEALDFSYVDNSLMSYAVANVSHESSPHGSSGAPRNTVVDQIVMGQGLLQSGLADDGSISEGIDVVAAWGLLDAAVGTSAENMDAARASGTSAVLTRNGADPSGAEVTQQAARDVFSALSKSIRPPLLAIDCPLVSSGAVYHEYTREEQEERAKRGLPYEVGTVVDHNPEGSFFNRIHKGSRVLSRGDVELYRTRRSLGLAQINVELERRVRGRDGKPRTVATGFRYGWFIDRSKLDEVFDAVAGHVGESAKYLKHFASDLNEQEYAMTHGDAAKVEVVMNALYAASRALAGLRATRGSATEADYDKALEAVRNLRRKILPLFKDHHGRPITEYSEQYQNAVGFDDLQILRADGTRGFDRTAVVEDMPSLDGKEAGGLWLAGTTFGLPRVPSYNGSMWCQTVRASVPCTETVAEEGGATVYRPGRDAMCMPDPQTLKILGCDHDGDKSKCYMILPNPTTGTRAASGFEGVSRLSDEMLPSALRGVPPEGVADRALAIVGDPAARAAYVRQLVDAGWLTGGGVVHDSDAGRDVPQGYRVSHTLRKLVSDEIVQSCFDMSRALVNIEADHEVDFYGTPFARATRANPLEIVFGKEDPRWAELKDKSLEVFNYLKRSKIAVPKTGANVSTSASIADRTRGSAVHWASVLHLARFSGMFDHLFTRDGGPCGYEEWVQFLYLVDGLSNATFDDIKEQVCLRMGWTPNMIRTFLADAMFNGRGIPLNGDEMYEVLDRYVSDVAGHGSRFWMMIASEPSDSDDVLYTSKWKSVDPATGEETEGETVWTSRLIHQEVWSLFTGRRSAPATQRGFRADVVKALGLGYGADGSLYLDRSKAGRNAALASFMDAYIREVRAGKVKGVDPSDGGSEEKRIGRALRMLVNDISRNKGFNPAAGYVRWLVGAVASKEGDAGALVRDFVKWSNGCRELDEAEAFSRSINFMKANPGSGHDKAALGRMRKAFSSTVKRRVGDKGGAPRGLRQVSLMHAALVCEYTATDADTVQGAGVVAAESRADNIGWLALDAQGHPDAALDAVVEGLFAEPGLAPGDLMQLEGQFTTVPFFLAALMDAPQMASDVGDDLLGGGGAERVWPLMEAMSRAVTRTEADPDPEPSTLGFHKAFLSLFGSLYGLATTSRQSTDFAGLYHVFELPIEGEFEGLSHKRPDGVGQLAPKFRDTDRATLELMWELTDRIADGSVDSMARATALAGAEGTKARSFVLSTKNLEAFLGELEGAGARTAKKAAKRTALSGRVKSAIAVMRELDAAFGKPVEVSPSTLVNQLFPLYATSVARSTAPDPKSRSVLNLFRGLYERLAKGVARIEAAPLRRARGAGADGALGVDAKTLMGMVCSTDLALPVRLLGKQPVRPPTLKGLTKAELDSVVGSIAGSYDERAERFAYEDDKGLNAVLEKIRGSRRAGGPLGSVRANPKNRHYVGFLEGTQLLRSVQNLLESAGAGTPVETREPEPPVDPVVDEVRVTAGEPVDGDVERLASSLQAAVGDRATITCDGGSTFTVRFNGGLKGAAATLFAGAVGGAAGKAVDAVIKVSVGDEATNARVDVNSPAFALSFCAAARGLKLTADEFLSLTREEREALVNAYCGNVEGGVANFALSAPSWTVSAEGVATLVGAVHLGKGASAKKLYHEYFHSVVGMFRTIGVFGEEDLRQLRDTFGKPPKGSDLGFDEERAADAFAEYVEGKTGGRPSKVEGAVASVFHRLYMALKSFFGALASCKFGFQYADAQEDGANPLFHLVLSGYTAFTRPRARELGLGEAGLGLGTMLDIERGAEAARLNADILARLAVSERRRVEGDPEADALARLERRAADRGGEPEGGDSALDEETGALVKAHHDALMEELARDVPRKAAVSGLARALAELRSGSAPSRHAMGDIRFSISEDDLAGPTPEELKEIMDEVYADAGPAEAPLTSETVEERADPAAIERDAPGIDPEVAEAMAKVRAGVDAALQYDPIDRGSRAGVQNGARRLLTAASNLATRDPFEYNADDLTIVRQPKVVNNVYARLSADIATGREVSKGQRRRAMWAHGLAVAATKQLSRLTGDNYRNRETVDALIHLYSSHFFTDAANRTFRQMARSVYGDSDGNAVARAALHASAAGMAGALMAAGGRQFGSLIHMAIGRLTDLSGRVGKDNATADTLAHVVSQLRGLVAGIDITTVLEDPRSWQAAVDGACKELFSGITRGPLDLSTGEYGDYANADVVTGETAARNQRLYQFADGGDASPSVAIRQKALRLAADAIFITAAQVKFMNEFGTQPGDFHHDAWTGRVTSDPMSFSEMTLNFGVGQSTLASGNPIVAQWNQPTFIAANLDDWYAGTVRETFGAAPVREMAMRETARLRGLLSATTAKVNFLSMYWGLNRPEGRKLLRLKRFRRTHEMGADFIKALDGGETAEGFTNNTAGRDTVDDSLSLDQYRDVVLVHRLARAYMNGDDKVIFGIDGIKFSEADLVRPLVSKSPKTGRETRQRSGVGVTDDASRVLTREDLSIERISRRMETLTTSVEDAEAARSEDYRAISPIEMTLYRMWHQLQSSLTGIPTKDTGETARSTVNLYNRLVDEVIAAARAAASEKEGDAWAPGEYNDFILRWLEGKGLVVATAADDSLRDPETKRPYLTEAALCAQASDIERMWEQSEALEVLARNRVFPEDVDEASGATLESLVERVKAEKLNARAIADELGGAVKSLKDALRDMPWLTRGEARHLHRLDSMIETLEGAGDFMYHALRAERDTRRESEIRIGRHEMTWHNMLADLAAKPRAFTHLTPAMLNMVADYFGTRERGDALMDAMRKGRYAAGSKASAATGLVVNPPTEADQLGTTCHDVAAQVYRKQLERKLMLLEGREVPNPEASDAITRMIKEYESAAHGDAVVRGAGSITGTQLYRLHGSLPANFTAGNAVMTMMRGLQDSLLWRSTLVNMLFTPDENGDPVFMMSPDRFRGDESGVSDGVWKAAAEWWLSRLGSSSLRYDPRLSGAENARRVFEAVQSSGKREGGTYAAFKRGEKRYATLGQDEIDGSAIAGVMAMVGPDDGGAVNRWGSSRGLFSLDGSEALGYARQLFQTSRVRDGARAQWLKHILAWSKTLSVTYSIFFPVATKWESPTAAVGALATLGSNLSPDFLRKHGAAASAVQRFFTLGTKEGWIDENFLGYKDVIRMMDTNDPFLTDLVEWAEAIGITMSSNVMSPLEPHKGSVLKDVERVKAVIGRHFGDKAANNFGAMMDALLFHQSERTFGYLLNATKLAVAAQVALRLKSAARARGKAFDPIRDMRGYAEYVDSEVGGVNPVRFAWAHPQMRRFLNYMWFSWQWTRTAWEAAGGGIVEDVLFGGHAASKEQRGITLGRWMRMYVVVMHVLPFLLQFSGKALATVAAAALGLPPDPDDDEDKWFTWENDSKVGAGAFGLSPLLKLVSKMDDAYFGGALDKFKTEGGWWATAAGAAVGAAVGGARGGVSGAVLGAAPGALVGRLSPSLLPMYTGTDKFNTNSRRQIFGRFGKQGWEPIRWLTDPVAQFFSKLNPTVQATLTGVLGFNPGNPDFDTGMSESLAVRLLPIKPDGARDNLWSGLLGVFRPFSLSGITQFGDAGALNMGVSIQMGSSKSSLQRRAVDEINKWVNNDREGYAFGAARRVRGSEKPRQVTVGARLADVRRDARAMGIRDFDKEVLIPALAKVVPGLYRELFAALPRKPDDSYDTAEVARITRKLHRVGRAFERNFENIEKKYLDQWSVRRLDPAFRKRLKGILLDAERDPFKGGEQVPLGKKDY